MNTGALPAPLPVDPDDPPWGIAGAVGVFFMTFVLMFVVQLVFLGLYIFKRGVPLAPDALAEFATKDISAIFVQVVSIIPAHLLTLGLAWLVVTRAGKYPFFESLGWKPDATLTFWKCAGLAVLLLLLSLAVVKITGNPETALDKLIESSRATALATAFAATFTAPLVEEIVFRGLLYSALQRLTGAVTAVIVVALLFAGIHVFQYWGNYGVITSILVLSFTLTTIRARTGKLLPCFFVHLVFNAIQSFFIVLNPYFERLAPEKSPAPGAIVHALLSLLHSAL
ncbi:MAG TPA: CPBP family intramembrane glutamic endopeptidase [Pyrinomonadaceae bacterium]|nr:CPBP family intramembrane glutamic endopeptidase [Pyrinomonadaceae bacterium]